MILRTLVFAFLLFCPALQEAKAPSEPIEIVVLIPSYNNEKWVKQNLESVVSQTYPRTSIYYVNDCSSDKTKELVDAFIKEKNLESRSTVVHNKERCHALLNTYTAIHNIAPHKVVVILDGDDTFAHSGVLQRIADAYADQKTWMTYGDYRVEPASKGGSCCTRLSRSIARRCSFRSHRWVYGPVRTFYAKLFHRIKKEDLMWNNAFFTMSGDVAFMFPLLEMASLGHIQYIPECLYIYNVVNPLNDHRLNPDFQLFLEQQIRAKPRYKPLQKLF